MKEVLIILFEVVVCNVMVGSFVKWFGKEEGELILNVIVEFYYKDDVLDDLFINDDYVFYLEFVIMSEMDIIC